MITPILEKLLLSGKASIQNITLTGSTQFVLNSLNNKTNIITKIKLHPFMPFPNLGLTEFALLDAIFYGPNSPLDGFDSVSNAIEVLKKSAIQLQIRNKYGQHFFVSKPEINYRNTQMIDSSGGVGNMFYPTTELNYTGFEKDVFIMFDSDQYITLNSYDDVRSQNPTADFAFKKNVPDGTGITTLANNTTAGSGTNFVQKLPLVPDAGIFRPADSQYMTLGFSTSAELSFQFYGTTPFINLSINPGGEQTINPLSKLSWPFIDMEIVTINEVSALKQIII